MTARSDVLVFFSIASLLGCSAERAPEEPVAESSSALVEGGEESRNIEFEMIKNDMQKLTQSPITGNGEPAKTATTTTTTTTAPSPGE